MGTYLGLVLRDLLAILGYIISFCQRNPRLPLTLIAGFSPANILGCTLLISWIFVLFSRLSLCSVPTSLALPRRHGF